ncbi:YtxH domain-containing protein [Haloflavibacter putidus]|uniref:YtxH domain-containing protein n=1 Tax=Haloflavibacter putidus TaxID=2576776 RepID=A0A507ZWS9_9FLAO|nr:YtxH domain-containing protein [Haloflavibacter putidus]TQD40724.1 YtxH domain-containing protein [Haloflavibacter putidus]
MANSGNTFLALITGAAIGAGIGMLYAPDSGVKTRKKLNKEAKKAKGRFDKQMKETTSQLSDTAQKAKVNFETRLEETLSSASYKADDILKSMESKLEELREKNARLQKEVQKEEAKTKGKKLA